ncbi:hypothetical protein GQ457_06G003080 [Hibiscus cannabinus]
MFYPQNLSLCCTPLSSKSPGPDGYISWFFNFSWNIVKSDFLVTVRHFFSTSFLLASFNATIIALIPKAPNSTMAKKFQPISCCTVVYKTITKILANRLATYFPGMIDPSQSAFVKG